MPAEERNDQQEIFLNGVDYVTGSYLSPPVTLNDLVQIAQDELRQVPQGEQNALKLAQKRKSAKTYGFAANLDDIQEANWGVIFAQDESVEVRNAIQVLVEHRSRLIGKDAPVFTYRPGWSANQFLACNGVQSGFGDAETVPYYLLLVGGPERIPWRLQYQLAGEYGVGRLAFEQAADYQDYIDRLIDYETSAHIPNRREAVFWATANQSAIGWKDQATQLSSSVLAQGLFDSLPDGLGFEKTMLRSAEATKS
ncbi:MAG TPA: C25 family cysteine peptidase, partial [Anaerolineaceae bacterium]|nr:C25 family cysteine peptidase [Anaerolineaceae bacterium]